MSNVVPGPYVAPRSTWLGRTETSVFIEEVQMQCSSVAGTHFYLNRLNCGVVLTQVFLKSSIWPLEKRELNQFSGVCYIITIFFCSCHSQVVLFVRFFIFLMLSLHAIEVCIFKRMELNFFHVEICISFNNLAFYSIQSLCLSCFQ